MHSLLARQLRKVFGSEGTVPDAVRPLLARIDDAYCQFDDDRRMLERSLDLSSQELLQRNTEMRAVFGRFPDLFFRLKVDGTILDCNPGNGRHLHGGPGGVIGRRIQNAPWSEVAAKFDEALRRVRERQESVVIEYTIGGRGAEEYYEANLLPVEDSNIIVFVRDIGERKRAESERTRLFAAIEQSADVVVITDDEGKIQYVNPSFERVTGYMRDEVMGRNPRFLRSGVQDDVFFASLWSTLQSGNVWRGRFVNRRKDDSLFQLESAISPVREGDGRIVSHVMVGRDVSRETELEEQLRQAQKMEAIGRLAGGIAHDFNNLLTAITGNADLVAARMREADPMREEMDEIRKAAQRAASLTSQLLALSRRQVLHPKAVNLNKIVRDASRMLASVLGETIELKLHLAPDLWPVHADPARIEQALINLVINARDAMPQGGRLTISSANCVLNSAPLNSGPDDLSGDYAVVRVEDTGVGMDPATRRHLFEPFFTTKAPGKGTGLGLATAYGIARQSGGTIRVDSELGRGSCFSLYLPRTAGCADGEPDPVPVAAGGGTETILLAEDEEQVRRLTRILLERQGYRVLEARNGQEALGVAQAYQGPIDLLLTDVIMPVMGGEALAQALATVRPGTKIIFMSGHPDTTVETSAVLADARRFIAKPFTREVLVSRLRAVLDDGADAPGVDN